MIVGAQLFTLRNSCKTLEDFSESLEKVADIGYTAVQISGTCPYEGEWLKEQLDKTGLIAPVTHTAAKKIIETTDEVLKTHQAFGCKNIGLGASPVPLSDETIESFLDSIAPAVEKISAAGAKFCYHNHWQEFCRSKIDKKLFIDKICERFPAEKLGIILDTYWVQFSGADPCQWIQKLKGRLDCIHFKDMGHIEEFPRMYPVGEGNMNWDGIIKSCCEADVKYAFVEQDNCYDEDPFDCLKRSYQFLKAQGLN